MRHAANLSQTEVQQRLRRLRGISATRKGLLLRDWQRLSATRLKAFPHTCSLHDTLRGMAAFIASTENGPSQLPPPGAMRRAMFALRYAERALAQSNNRLAAMIALTFGCARHSDTLKGLHDDYDECDGGECDENDEDEDEAPLTPDETVALLQWTARHALAALRIVSDAHDERAPIHIALSTAAAPRPVMALVAPTATDDGEQTLALLCRFAALVVDGALRRGAVGSAADEHQLAIVTQRVAHAALDRLEALIAHGPFRPLHINEKAQQALLSSQREDWESALDLLLRTQRWNSRAEGPVISSSVISSASASSSSFVWDCAPGPLPRESVQALCAAPGAVQRMLQYIFAQHGQWTMCRQLWRTAAPSLAGAMSTSSLTSSPTSSLTSSLTSFAVSDSFASAGAAHVIAALACVNAVGPGAPSDEERARLLRLLLHLGLVPQRSPSPAEFAALLRQSFGLPMGVDGILSPAFVWRRAEGLPGRVRAALCMLCFHVVTRSGLAHTLALDDLYAVTCVSRQYLLQSQWVDIGTGKSTNTGEEPEARANENESADTSENIAENMAEDEDDGPSLASLQAELLAATRRTAAAMEAHVIALTEAFLARRRELLPDAEDNDCASAEYSLGPAVRRPSAPRRAVAARRSQSTVLLSLVSRELMALLTSPPYASAIGVTWQAALCATSDEVLRGAGGRRTARALSALSALLSQRACLTGPLARVLPHVAPGAAWRALRGPAARGLSAAQCERALRCAPPASELERILLLRAAQRPCRGGEEKEKEQKEKGEKVRGGATSLTIALRRSATALHPRLLRSAGPALAAQCAALHFLAERDWRAALIAFRAAGERVQCATAPHVTRLTLRASALIGIADDVLIAALRSSEGEAIAREAMHVLLRGGDWSAGVALMTVLRREQPALLRTSQALRCDEERMRSAMRRHASTAQAVATLSLCARGAKWREAAEMFLKSTRRGSSGGGGSGGAEERRPCYEGKQKEVIVDEGVAEVQGAWLALFQTRVPDALVHVAHTLRYCMIASHTYWEMALAVLPERVFPLPLSHHRLLRACRRAHMKDSMSNGEKDDGAAAEEEEEEEEDKEDKEGMEALLRPSLMQLAHRTVIHRVDTDASTHLGARAMCANTNSAMASRGDYSHALRELTGRGAWEDALRLCTRALAARRLPHADVASLVSAPLGIPFDPLDPFGPLGSAPLGNSSASSSSSWAAALAAFALLSSRLRPDAAATVAALRACAAGGQWVLALRVLRQCVLTSPQCPPAAVACAIRAASEAGAWAAALRVARQHTHTRSPALAHEVLLAHARAERWADAVAYFAACVARGMRPMDEALAIVIAAGRAAAAECRDATHTHTVKHAHGLEDVCDVRGMMREHVHGVGGAAAASRGPMSAQDTYMSAAAVSRAGSAHLRF